MLPNTIHINKHTIFIIFSYNTSFHTSFHCLYELITIESQYKTNNKNCYIWNLLWSFTIFTIVECLRHIEFKLTYPSLPLAIHIAYWIVFILSNLFWSTPVEIQCFGKFSCNSMIFICWCIRYSSIMTLHPSIFQE